MSVPHPALSYLRIAWRSGRRVPGDNPTLPREPMSSRVERIDRAHLQRFKDLIGWTHAEVPPTYPYLLCMPLHLAQGAREDFPLPVVGVAHKAERIEVLQPLPIDRPWDLSAQWQSLRRGAGGYVLELRTELSVDGVVCWRSTTTAVRKLPPPPGSTPTEADMEDKAEGKAADGNTPPPAECPVSQSWALDTGFGRRYAPLALNFDPIHMFAATAKPFGYSGPVAHGMALVARGLAALDPALLAAPVDIQARFRRPVVLPTTVTMGAAPSAKGWQLGIWSPEGKVCITAKVRGKG